MSTGITVKEFMRQDQVVQSFRDVLGEREANAYISSVLIAVANSQALQECTPISIMSSALRAATLRLSCDPAIGQAYLVPFKGKCTLIIGYKGLKDMALRTGQYRYLNVATVHQGQTIVEDQLTGMHSFGEQDQTVEWKRNIPIGYLLYFELLNGFSKTYYMTVEEIDEHARKYSKSFEYSDSAWKTNKKDMQRKTVLRQGLMKWGYFDPHDSVALVQMERDEQEIIDAEAIEIKPSEPARARSELEILSDLGFDVPAPAPEPQPEPALEPKPDPEPASLPAMTLETAMAVTGQDGKAYGDCINEDLANKSIGILKALKANHLGREKREFYEYKLSAIQTILKARNNREMDYETARINGLTEEG